MKGSMFLAVMAILVRAALAQQIQTVGGTGLTGFHGDGGPALQATIQSPNALAVDSEGNVYLTAPVDFRVRKISPSGIITTVAGNGQRGLPPAPGLPSDDGKPATSVALGSPNGLAVDSSGNLYIADGYAIRKVDRSGTFTTFVGGGSSMADGVSRNQVATVGAWGLAFDSAGNLYYSEAQLALVRKVDTRGIVTTVAGKFGTIPGFSGDGGPATSATLNVPRALAIDTNGNVYIADSGNRRIRKVAPDGAITTVIGGNPAGYGGDNGPAAQAQFRGASGMACDPTGALYFADADNHRVRRISPDGIITTVAGNGQAGASGDGGPATAAQLDSNGALALDGVNSIYVAGGNRIRKIGAAAGSQPQIAADGIVNAASFAREAAPGSLISIFGTGLASGTAQAGATPLPKTLAGTSVNIGGIQAPLLYVSPTQINLQLPYEVGVLPPVVVTANGVNSAASQLKVTDAIGLFTYGENRAVAQNQDLSLNDAAHPAPAGSVVVVYLTGGGATSQRPQTGSPAPSDPLSGFISAVTAEIGGQRAEVLFAGLAPGFIGLAQVNLRVPALSPGNYPLVVAVNGWASNAALISVR